MSRIRTSVAVLFVLLTLCTLGPAQAALGALTDADFTAHVEALNKKLPGDGFVIIEQRPFVVIGDETPAAVRSRAVRTVKWAVDMLKKEYFAKDPDRILDIWLFKDKDSYETNVPKLFGRKPHTPFGYYSAADGALVMNIATGGGTLVHEIVHPFVAANFPDCPAWFNEGLGSLYEQCGDRNGRINGYTNWRLAGLQKAINQKSVPSFKTLCTTTSDQFYRHDPGTNYSQARYLCYYLQEKGLLRKFYHQFVADHETDPTGYRTLQRILKEDDMSAFEQRWERWVMTLEFP